MRGRTVSQRRGRSKEARSADLDWSVTDVRDKHPHSRASRVEHDRLCPQNKCSGNLLRVDRVHPVSERALGRRREERAVERHRHVARRGRDRVVARDEKDAVGERSLYVYLV